MKKALPQIRWALLALSAILLSLAAVALVGSVLEPRYQGITASQWVQRLARESTVARFVRWFNQIDPGGGTQPKAAFEQVFSLEERPDVIYFLTDGLIPPETVAVVGAINARGRRVAINTIAFGDPSGQELLKDISARSGGVFRFVPANGP